jgi:NADH-quinone oxidoreductase subunit N
LAVLAGGAEGARAASFYLLAYTLTSMVAFAVLLSVMDNDDRGDRLERFAGLGRRRPWLAAAMALAMLSLAGFPPTAGFIGKLLVFQAAISAGYVPLAVLAIITSVVAVVFYTRVVLSMFLRDGEAAAAESTPLPAGTSAVLALGALGTLVFGLFAGTWLQFLGRLPGGF